MHTYVFIAVPVYGEQVFFSLHLHVASSLFFSLTFPRRDTGKVRMTMFFPALSRFHANL